MPESEAAERLPVGERRDLAIDVRVADAEFSFDACDVLGAARYRPPVRAYGSRWRFQAWVKSRAFKTQDR